MHGSGDELSVSCSGVEPPHCVFALAWTVYVRPAFVFLLSLAIGLVIANLSWLAGLTVMLAALVWFIWRVLEYRSVRLYTDDDGVWRFGGIFPWNKGVSGVKWRDLDEATYAITFFGWAARSYRVRIGHRFTKSSELLLSHVRHGDAAVTHINSLHLKLVNGENL